MNITDAWNQAQAIITMNPQARSQVVLDHLRFSANEFKHTDVATYLLFDDGHIAFYPSGEITRHEGTPPA